MRIAIALAGAAVLAALAAGAAESKQDAPRLLLKSAVALNAKAGTVTLPLFKGRSANGSDVWYVITESSSRADARERGVSGRRGSRTRSAPRRSRRRGYAARRSCSAER